MLGSSGKSFSKGVFLQAQSRNFMDKGYISNEFNKVPPKSVRKELFQMGDNSDMNLS
jgi:hypothetical protein